MREDIRAFLGDMSARLHNDRVTDADIEKALNIGKQEKQWELESQGRKAREVIKADIYRRGEIPLEDQKAREEGTKELLGALKPEIEKSVNDSMTFWDSFNNSMTDNAEKEAGERLIEIREERNDLLDWRIREAEARGNEIAAERYKKEKEANEKKLKAYREVLKDNKPQEQKKEQAGNAGKVATFNIFNESEAWEI